MPPHKVLHEIHLYFQYQDVMSSLSQLKEQQWASLLSPVVAKLCMESFEQSALTFPLTSKVWIRYVEDTFMLWPHSKEALDRFQQHLNSQHPSIQFTWEEESENNLLFLDVFVKRKATHT